MPGYASAGHAGLQLVSPETISILTRESGFVEKLNYSVFLGSVFW